MRLEREEKEKRNDFEELVRRKMEEINSLASQNTDKIDKLEKIK